ncbi:MAG: HAMP domain-containing protein [Elusimicrobiaceae bacterium]|nr:HAMP domain-containing protein [Elusimicrobiaceae bacterium]
MTRKRFRSLFVNALLALSLISLVLLVFISIHLTRVNSRILQHEIFQKQQIVASRLATIVHSYLTHTSEYFTVFADLHTDFGGHSFLDQVDLNYLRRKNEAVSYLTLLDQTGRRLISSGISASSDNYQQWLPAILQTCIDRQDNYLGPVFFTSDRGWFILMAFPVYEYLNAPHPAGVLLAEINLRSLGEMLVQAYPLEMEAFIVDNKREVVAYNGAAGGLVTEPMPELNEQAQAIEQQLIDQETGEVSLPNGHKWLVASAPLFMPGWKVYVAQPANITSKLVFESTIHSSWDVLRILLVMILFVFGISYWVIIPITRPLEQLRQAVLKLRERDMVIRWEDVDIPNNEIGDLAEAFVTMSKFLYLRRKELVATQAQLKQANQTLEQRVEERTRELKEATQELVKNERLATMGQMASIISHEIRNPLAVISNATRLIKMLLKTPDLKVSKQLGIIDAEIKQANSIISEVLGYARSRDLILSAISVNSYVHDILVSYPLPTGIKLVEKLDIASARVKIDTEEMKQALRNLITNAVEAMGGQGTLTVGTKVGRRAVCIFVTDTGPGIPAEIRQKIFTPFFTTKARGTGLGLAVVGKAVSRHRGKLFISSEQGKGSCFQIYLKIYHKPGDTYYGTAD